LEGVIVVYFYGAFLTSYRTEENQERTQSG